MCRFGNIFRLLALRRSLLVCINVFRPCLKSICTPEFSSEISCSFGLWTTTTTPSQEAYIPWSFNFKMSTCAPTIILRCAVIQRTSSSTRWNNKRTLATSAKNFKVNCLVVRSGVCSNLSRMLSKTPVWMLVPHPTNALRLSPSFGFFFLKRWSIVVRRLPCICALRAKLSQWIFRTTTLPLTRLNCQMM